MSEANYQPAVNAKTPPSLVFGENASNVRTFPKTRPDTDENGYSNFLQGIPSDYSTNAQHPLKAQIEDVNAIGRLASGFHHYRQCGGLLSYNPEVASLIEGYPKGAILEWWDGTNFRRVVSLMENNLYDYVKNPDFIDGVHWAYADSWGQPYGIFVDPCRVSTLNVLEGGRENPDLGWGTDDSEYNWVGVVLDSQGSGYTGKLSLRKSKWVQINHDCFVVISISRTNAFGEGYPSLYWMVAGYRVKDSKGVVKTFPMNVSGYWYNEDHGATEVAGTVFPVMGNWSETGSPIFYVGYSPGSSCLYMSRGSMIQIVYSPQIIQNVEMKICFVGLKGR